MTWRYVASRELLPDGLGGTEESWSIREFYEEIPGSVGPGWSKDAIAPRGVKLIELLDDLGRMMDGAMSRAFLDLSADPPGLVQRPTKKTG